MLPFMPLEGQLCSLLMRLHRAARAFLDPELQSGAITPAEAHAFLQREIVYSAPFARSEVERYTFRAPGQATSYFYGYTKLVALRAEVEAALGARFDPLAFHDFIVDQGLIPPDALRAAVLDRFVQRRPLVGSASRNPSRSAFGRAAANGNLGGPAEVRRSVKAIVYHGERDVRVETVPDPSLKAPTDAIVRVVNAAICGSDLWPYRGIGSTQPGSRIGHEFTGVVEAVGADVRGVAVGQFVAAPFSYAEGHCAFCRDGLYTSCKQAGFWGGLDDDGGQGEFVRVPVRRRDAGRRFPTPSATTPPSAPPRSR